MGDLGDLGDSIIKIISYSSNHLEDKVPVGSILKSVYVQKIEDDIFIYNRIWKIFHNSINIKGICYLEGTNWLSKIDNLFELCQLSRFFISSMKINSDNSVQINFFNKHVQYISKSKISVILKCYYTNRVFVE